MRHIGMALVAVLALAACGGGTSPSKPASTATTGGDPVGLIGLWTVMDAGEEPGAVLRVAPDEISLWRACGWLAGSWRATRAGAFVASIDSGSGHCDLELAPRWLESANRFELDPGGAQLLDATGVTVARLTPGGSPTAGPDDAPELAAPPSIDPKAMASVFDDPQPLPSGVTPATQDSLMGTWLPLDSAPWQKAHPANTPPSVTFSAARYTGTDGCNGFGGRWAIGAGGSLVATTGPSTMIGCDNVDIGSWVGDAARAGFDGDVLVLYDRSGHETGRLRHA